MRRLLAVLARFRPEVRADLADRGIDLTEWWRARRWRALLEMITQLPRASRTRRAMMDDPETAAMILDSEDDEETTEDEPKSEKWAPPLDQYGLTEELLVVIANQLMVQRYEIARMMTGKGSEPNLIGTPRTLVDELRERRAETATLALLAMLMPDTDPTTWGRIRTN